MCGKKGPGLFLLRLQLGFKRIPVFLPVFPLMGALKLTPAETAHLSMPTDQGVCLQEHLHLLRRLYIKISVSRLLPERLNSPSPVDQQWKMKRSSGVSRVC